MHARKNMSGYKKKGLVFGHGMGGEGRSGLGLSNTKTIEFQFFIQTTTFVFYFLGVKFYIGVSK
jgi:hypothetical protein